MEHISIMVPLSRSGITMLNAFTVRAIELVEAADGPAPAAPKAKASAAAPAAAPVAAAPEGGEKRGRGRPPKAPAAPVAPADDLDLGLGGDEPPAGDELGLDDDTPPLTLEGDVIPAFKKFLEVKKDKVAAGAILAKHGVKSVRDLPEPTYAAVIAALKV